jgi:hypothetical protein
MSAANPSQAPRLEPLHRRTSAENDMRLVTAGVLAAGLVVAGCGSDNHGVNQADVQAYAALSQQLSTAATTYGAAASATIDVESCQSTNASYDAQVHPMVDRMRSMSGAMDQQMGTMGHTGDADMTCGADAMAAELAHHDAVACASTMMSSNHDEAARHATAMTAWADHQHARADEMAGMMGTGGSGMMGSGGTMTVACHRNGDGTFTLGP